MNTQREFVQLKEHYIADVTLKFANGLKKEGQFGPYLLYSVLHEGKEKFLKVTDRLEKQFRKFDVKAGQVVSLLKETITPKNGEPFTVINVLECKDAPKPEKKEEPVPQKVESNPQIPQTPEGFSGDTLMMYQSLHDAVDMTKTIDGVEWRNTDIEKIGVCLFLSRTGQLTVDKVLSNGNGNGLVRRIERRSNFQYVLVYDESRWGRAMNPRENVYWKMHFEKCGVRVWVIHSSSRHEDDIGSYVIEVVESAEASEYSKKLSRSIRRGMMSDQQGKYSRGGTAPYGYKRVAIDLQTGEKKDLRDGLRSVPRQEKVVWELGDPLEVDTVKRIFDMKAMGTGYVGIADRLNSEGILCPRRGRWRNQDQKWSGGSVMTIIQNPAYTGDRVYNRLSFSKFVAREKGLINVRDRYRRSNIEGEWIVVPNAHPAIIKKELFEKANLSHRQVKINGQPNQHFYRSTYLLTGLIKCKQCQFNYQGFSHKQSGNRYYVDGGYLNKGKSVCNWFSIRQDILEEFVLDSVRDSLLDPVIIKKTEQILRETLLKESPNVEKGSENIESRSQKVDEKIKHLLRLAEEGVGLDLIANHIKELEEQKRLLDKEKEKLIQQKNKILDAEAVIDQMVNYFNNFERSFKKSPIDEKKELLRNLVAKIEVDRDIRKVQCYLHRFPALKTPWEPNLLGGVSSANGIRTRITALRGRCPNP